MTESIFSPNVDICEDSEVVRLTADMPGVDQAAASVTVENGVLTMEGQAHLDEPQGYTYFNITDVLLQTLLRMGQ